MMRLILTLMTVMCAGLVGTAHAQGQSWTVYGGNRAAVQESRGAHAWLNLVCREQQGSRTLEAVITVTDPHGRATPELLNAFRIIAEEAPDRDGIEGLLAVMRGTDFDQSIRLYRRLAGSTYEFRALLGGREPTAIAHGTSLRAQLGQVNLLFTGNGSARAMAQIGCPPGAAGETPRE